MRRTLLWLLASLGLACFTSVTRADPLKVLSAPNVLRVGTAENIFVECQDCEGQSPMDVQISAWNYPARNVRLHQTTVTLNSDNDFQAFGELVVPPDTFDKNPEMKQFVYLRAEFPGFTLEKFVLVSFQSGYIFIQTDKTLYTPDSIVNFRIFAVTPDMKAFARDVSVVVEIVTPDGIVIPLGPFAFRSGLHHGSYRLGDIVSVGQWKVVARFQANPQQQYSAEFDVKEYVLPSFEVKLTPDSPFYYYDTESFSLTVTATYLFGRDVDGFAYVVFGVMRDNIRKVFPDSLQRIPIAGGSGRATLQKAHIRKTFWSLEDLVGGALFATATVHTESGSEMVEAELRNMHIVKSPYVISFDKTPKYFKPGLPYDVTVTVTNPDGTPAGGIPIVLQPGRNTRGTTRANGRVTLSVQTKPSHTNLTITATTNANHLPANRQTSESMVAKAHQSKGGNFIHIAGISTDVEFGTILRVALHMNNQRKPFEITCLVISRGQLVEFGRQNSENQPMMLLNIPVTKKMLPSFRLIVYYHPTRTEVVSDSIWVDVDDSCMGTLKLEPKRQQPSYEPRRTFVLKITGEPGATVGLVAVDKGVYVLSKKHLLTQKKVWEIVEKADTGCTPGGGENSMGVFFDAGLMFQTDTADETLYRQEVDCPRPAARKRRAPTLLDAKTTLVSTYTDPLQRECCLDGMRNTPLSYTCAQRILYVTDGKACADAFLHCCEELAKQRDELKKHNLILSRSEEEDDMESSDWITSRTKFPESWNWVTVRIPQCTRNPHCEVNTLEMPLPLKDSITTWVFTGISLSQNNGICVGNPLDVVVSKDFFLDLRLPYSAVLGEQIEIRAIVHSYLINPITVIIELFENQDLCSLATKHGKYTQTVDIGPTTTKAVPFIIIPMKEGQLNIEVKAFRKGNVWEGDGVIKLLRVVPNGVLTTDSKVVELAPKGGTQELTVNNPIPRTAIVPNTKPRTKAFLTGREQVSPLVDTLTGVSSVKEMIYKPTGCGEQNLIHMTSPVLATIYLDKTHQWEAVGLEKRSEALSHIRTGAQNEMEFAKSDGSFAIWKSSKSNTWLTAYVVRVFSMASTLVEINSNTICKAGKFLIHKTQQTNGMFREIGRNSHRMFSVGPGRNPDASMTALCLMALQKSQTICYRLENRFPDAMAKAVNYLEQRLQSLTDPYAVAITSYALASANKLDKEMLYRFASSDRTHWEVPQGHVFTLEATAYALLALVKGQFLTDARPVVRWLTRQRKVGGGYGSTQATVLVYQALFEYWSVAQEPDYNMDVELTIPGRSIPYNFRFTQDDHYTTRTSKNFDGNQNVKVTATGTGAATLTLVTQYYAVPKKTLSDCRKFNLSVEFSLDKAENEGDIYKLRMYFKFINKREDASMSILDITLPTGFIPMNEDLNLLSGGRAPVFSKWEYNKVLSERGSIIIYLPKVAHRRVEEVTFRMRQTHKVGVLQPASVSIYEYYDETKCVRYYHPQRKDGQLLYRCRGDECLCAEENCSMQQKGHINNRRRLEKACETNLTSFIDFVYRVTLEEVNLDVTFDTYTMRIETVIKEGSYDKNAQGQRRNFISLSHCRKSLDLQKGRGYLIMGTADSTLPGASAQSFEYVLSERTWIEHWPRGEECQRPEHSRTCIDMNALIVLYETQGCQL